jgi:hypothetical protein
MAIANPSVDSALGSSDALSQSQQLLRPVPFNTAKDAEDWLASLRYS